MGTDSNRIIRLNVGGVIYTTFKSTLENSGSGFFASLVDDNKKDPIAKIGGNIFIDYDPKIFDHLLEYMRDKDGWTIPKHVLEDDYTIEKLKRSIDYFCFPKDLVDVIEQKVNKYMKINKVEDVSTDHIENSEERTVDSRCHPSLVPKMTRIREDMFSFNIEFETKLDVFVTGVAAHIKQLSGEPDCIWLSIYDTSMNSIASVLSRGTYGVSRFPLGGSKHLRKGNIYIMSFVRAKENWTNYQIGSGSEKLLDFSRSMLIREPTTCSHLHTDEESYRIKHNFFFVMTLKMLNNGK